MSPAPKRNTNAKGRRILGKDRLTTGIYVRLSERDISWFKVNCLCVNAKRQPGKPFINLTQWARKALREAANKL